MEHVFIKTENYIKLFEGIQELKDLPDDAPKMGIGHGYFGLGKTIALEKIATDEDAVLLRAVQAWSLSSCLSHLCFELGLDETGTSSSKFDRVIDYLVRTPRIIIIDEIDAILKSEKKNVLEMLRDIHDIAHVVVFFVGMQGSIKKFRKDAHYYSRFAKKVELTAISRNDIAKYCEAATIKIEDDLITYFSKQYPNLRQIKVIIIRLEKYCMLNDFESANYELFKASNIEKNDEI